MYIRMVLTMLIGLFSVRIVLQALGTEDFGIYNVVGGVVTMLAFLNNALSSSTQRFLSFELGKGNKARLSVIFCTNMTLYIWLCVLILILSETIGLWFVNCKLIIPDNRIYAANWIYQFSILSFLFSILNAPYLAAIISREKMQVYAYASVISAFLKLGMIYGLLFLNGDKLIVYGLFLLLIGIAEFLFYYFYCKIHFEETRYRYFFDVNILKEIGGFTGWSIWGGYLGSFLLKHFDINIPFFIDSALAMLLFYHVGNLFKTENLYNHKMPVWMSVMTLLGYSLFVYLVKPEVNIKDNVFPVYLIILSLVPIYALYVISCRLNSKFLLTCGLASLTIMGFHHPIYDVVMSPLMNRLPWPSVIEIGITVVFTLLITLGIHKVIIRYSPFLLGK